MLNEFTTDECVWVYPGCRCPRACCSAIGQRQCDQLRHLQPFLRHIAICNNFVKVARDLRKRTASPSVATALRLFRRKRSTSSCVRQALRGLSYYNVMTFGDVGGGLGQRRVAAAVRRRPKAEPLPLYDKVVEDLEMDRQVLA